MTEQTFTLEQELAVLRSYFDECESELLKLKGGRKASSAKVRKSLQNIKTKSHGMRKSVTAHTKTIPTKTRIKKEIVEPVELVEEEEIPPAPKLVRQVAEKVKKPRKPKVKTPEAVEV